MPKKAGVYLCWSKGLGRLLAERFHRWIKDQMGDYIDPFFSPEDIEVGRPWWESLRKEMKDNEHAILFMTREMAHAPWVIFEAGAISRNLAKSRIIPVMVDIETWDLPAPLQQLQNIDKEQVVFVGFERILILPSQAGQTGTA
jgi:hypothetical protein